MRSFKFLAALAAVGGMLLAAGAYAADEPAKDAAPAGKPATAAAAPVAGGDVGSMKPIDRVLATEKGKLKNPYTDNAEAIEEGKKSKSKSVMSDELLAKQKTQDQADLLTLGSCILFMSIFTNNEFFPHIDFAKIETGSGAVVEPEAGTRRRQWPKQGRPSTFLSDSGNRSYIITTERMISGLVLK